MSLSIPDDNYFVQMLESIWMISENDESDVDKKHIDYLVSLLRNRLRSLSTPTISDEYVLRNFFNDSDTNKSGDLTIDELWNLCSKAGISCERKYISALFKKFDTNRNGVIEFEEFVDFVIHNAYTK